MRSALIAGLLLACAGEEPEARRYSQLLGAKAPDAAAKRAFLEEPSVYIKDYNRSEGAMTAASKGPLGALCRSLEAKQPARLQAVLAEDFAGRWFGPMKGTGLARSAQPEAAELAGAAWAEAVHGALGSEVVETCRLGVLRFRLTESGAALAEVLLDSLGTKGGRRIEHRLRARVLLRGERIHRFEGSTLSEVSTARRWFTEVAAQIGVGLHRPEVTRENLKAEIDRRHLETMGGLGVIDYDGDGRDDLMAWNRRRTLQVFVNDGRGGFDKVVDPIPPSQTGLFQLYVDLDGDGREEIVSSEVVGCAEGQAEFGLFRRGATWARVEGALRFPYPACQDIGGLQFQHIATADVDADGDLDLFFSGFKGPHSKGRDHNLFQASDGQPNVLMINQGGLRFSAEQRGLSDASFSYAATFFDVDGDRDPDLYVTNDYGDNQLWLNEGGRFRAGDGPLTENGQSMGVTVADVDGDLDLDVYVSNMFSKAGHRVIELSGHHVGAPTLDTLRSLARGNALYLRGTDGSYTESGVELGVARAGWAWGQAHLDVENDGDREIFVVNGMTSHTDARAPDF